MRVVNEEKKQAMLTESIRTLIPRMAVPTIVAQLITTIYNLVDTYFVSTLGTNATAAVGVNSSLERTITVIGSLLGAGACSYIARLLGANKKKEADQVLSTSFFTGLGLGILFMIICRLMIRRLVFWLGATEECAEYSVQYATYVLYAAPFMICSFILNMCLRSEGSALYSMIGIGFGGVLNCFLDPLFIYHFGLGVAGASMATAISKFISFVILLYPYVKKRTAVNISVRKIRYIAADVREVLAIGSSSFFRSALSVVAAVAMNHVAGHFSTAALAAVSVANRVMEFPFAIILGFGQGYQPISGFNWGAKQYRRVKESLVFAIMVSVAGSLIMGTLLFITAPGVVHLFNRHADSDVLRIGVLCIRLQCITLTLHGINSIVNMYYAGIGKALYALLINTSRQGYCFIPVLLVIPALLGENGIAAAQAIADALAMIVVIPLTIKAFHELDSILKESEATPLCSPL